MGVYRKSATRLSFASEDEESFLASDVYKAEWQRILKRRQRIKYYKGKPGDTPKNRPIGLCLSGGGIRSATFNLGVLQSLQKCRKLKWIDYISTVSGGGYIGSSLTWFRSLGFDFPFGKSRKDNTKIHGGETVEWLRAHGNYLMPGDNLNVWALLAAVLKGTVVSCAIVLPLFFFVFYLIANWHVDPDVVLKLCSDTNCMTIPPVTIIETFTWIGGLFFVAFLLHILLFSLFTVIPRMRSAIWQAQVRKVGGRILMVGSMFLVVGTIPLLHDLIYGDSELKGWIEEAMTGVSISGIIGIFSGLFKRTPGSETSPIRSFALTLGLSLAVYGIFLWIYHLVQGESSVPIWIWVLLGISFFLAIFSNINHVSMHRFYRNRLMEAYMPAELIAADSLRQIDNEMNADETPNHTLYKYYKEEMAHDVKGLRVCADQRRLARIKQHSDMPYHIINANIQTVDSPVAKLNERGGENFILSPLYCGSEHTTWLETKYYLNGKMNLATAMAISGAAVSPNMYATRSRPLSFIMSLLNLRLGYWTLNPKYHDEYGYLGRTLKKMIVNFNWYRCLFADLLGMGLNENRWLIHLSDGGHFENLGLYELIRRECEHIIVCDAGADPSRHFSDLAKALSMIRIDFGAEVIGMNTKKLVPGKDKEFSEKPYFICNIKYKSGKEGKLYYLKPTMLEDLPQDVLSYFKKNSDFPHQSTGDQFFDESQFEAYRELGFKLAELIVPKLNFDEGSIKESTASVSDA